MNKYTIEELQEKVVIELNKKDVEYGVSLSGGYIDDSFTNVLECFNSAFKELLKEKVNILPKFYEDYVRVDDIEELFNLNNKK